MRRWKDDLLLSPDDLATFLGCRHASALDRRALDESLHQSTDAPALELLQDLGITHEQKFLQEQKDAGRRVVRIPDGPPLSDRLRITIQAMHEGPEVIYQAALLQGAWHGFADFLLRVDTPSHLGPWSYEVADAKLSTAIKPRHALQLSLYSQLVAAVQDREAQSMSVILGDKRVERLRPADFGHYVRLAARRLERFLADATAWASTISEPCAHCEQCRWRERCAAEWEAADHLQLVANIRRSQRERLVAAGITTVASLAELKQGYTVPGLAPEILIRLQAQARLQVTARRTGLHHHELLALEPGRGFSRLPQPAAGDLFFDMEGDPLFRDPVQGDGGLEYLFGVHYGDLDTGTFRAFWAHDRAAEKKALEDFLDFVAEHLQQHSAAHIYHYNHYEVTAVRRLAMRHATRETMVDDLLRQGKFIDLFKVVREGLLISEPRYSLKNIEHFYMPVREGEVATAGDSIVAYEHWRVTHDQHILEEIERYNAFDCRSTAALHNWLIAIRPTDTAWLSPESVAPDAEALARQAVAEAERLAAAATLLNGVDEDEKAFRQLVVHLLEFHRREQKPEWWAVYDRQSREQEELVEDAECLAGLEQIGPPVPEKRSLVYTYHFPRQETKLRKKDRPIIIDTLESAGSIEDLDMRKRLVVLKRGANRPLPSSLNLGPGLPVDDATLRDAVRRFADSVAARDRRFAALEAILRRDYPRLSGRAPGEPLIPAGSDHIPAVITAVDALDNSYLFIQGPPGTGKTFTASRVILELLRRDKRIGVSSNSHKAINNLLAGIEKAARENNFTFQGYKKSTANSPDTQHGGELIRDVNNAADIPGDAPLVAGTAWLFARPEFEGRLDYLFVDEAGQVSLANLVAMGIATRNIVLLGDQMQLGQPIQGTHPENSGVSALEHLLQGVSTVPPSRGIFLDVTWRMHPGLCGWVSEAIYEGRLRSEGSTARQSLLLDDKAHPALAPFGLRFLEVEHQGRSQRSPEEVRRATDIWENLMGQRWRDPQGKEHAIGPDDVLVVAPFNVQVNALRAALPTARVGTVDKFQGQEAPVVLVSLTTSSGDEIPRDLEFLFSRNRLNVAISRARCLAVVLASPRLLEVPCGTVEELRLVNTLCHAYEWSKATQASFVQRTTTALPPPGPGVPA